MCGICGIVGLDAGEKETGEALQRMVRVMRHRGPDEEGFHFDGTVALGSARLSIIDVEHGSQPMSNEDGSVWIVYNGEVYNYVELTQELSARGHVFRTKSDTEAVIHSYEEYGDACVERFNGMFAFVLWDKARERLVLVRDRLGIKPLYYAYDKGVLVFGSEIKVLLESGLVRREVDMGAVAEYMLRSYVTGERTFLKSVSKLLPGHRLILERGSLRRVRYWDAEFGETEDRGEKYYVDKLSWLISDSVRLRLRSDVPLGAHLSGGIDSSTVVCTASRLLPHQLKTFSGAFLEGPRYDERRYIRVVTSACGTEHHEVIPTMEEFFESLPGLVWFLDEPVVGAGVFPQYAVSVLARNHVKVVLGGQGGDELFAGYTKYYRPYFTDRALDAARLHFGAASPGTLLSDFLLFLLRRGGTDIPAFFRRLSAPSPRELFSSSLEEAARDVAPLPGAEGRNKFERMLYADTKEYLQGLLHVEDRTSMAASIESRVPILDYRIVELAASIPYKHKMRAGRTKHVLRQAMKGVVPEVVLSRTDKMGFPTPIDIWFSRRRRSILSFLDSPQVRRRGVFHPDRALEMVRRHAGGSRDNSLLIWKMLNVELWFALFIEGKTVEEMQVFNTCSGGQNG
ncbi:MAG: asparagine synthase (glutamine-hydrolyzing) [Candidatus Eisenbacteria bacterium]